MQFAKETASEVQQELEELIKTNKSLKEHCGNAFVAFIRAYATYPSALKYIFHVKNLHLGHVAKSFALQVSEMPDILRILNPYFLIFKFQFSMNK